MNMVIFLILIASFGSAAIIDAQPCDFRRGPQSAVDQYERTWVECHLTDDPLALDRTLLNGTIPDPNASTSQRTGRRVHIGEIAPLVYALKISDYDWHGSHNQQNFFHRNCSVPMTIRPGTLANWTGLHHFEVSQYTDSSILDVGEDEFSGLPQLERIGLFGGVTLSESTLRAIASVSDRLRHLHIIKSYPWGEGAESRAYPQHEIIGVIANMTSLESVAIYHLQPFPPSTLHNSAGTLRSVRLWGCGLPMITREMFRGMRNLTNLKIHNCSTLRLCRTRSIEEGAFDELVNLEQVYLDLGLVRRLPYGLINKLKKLKRVHNKLGFENLSRDNFTHVDDFENFKLFD